MKKRHDMHRKEAWSSFPLTFPRAIIMLAGILAEFRLVVDIALQNGPLC
jgi:hypothetical protein